MQNNAISSIKYFSLTMPFYLLLGMFLEGMASLVLTLPITLPLITQAGFDPIWFGVFVIVTIEMAQITPPVGFNLFIIQSLTRDSIGRVARDALPFLGIMVMAALTLALFPSIALWLPEIVMNRLN